MAPPFPPLVSFRHWKLTDCPRIGESLDSPLSYLPSLPPFFCVTSPSPFVVMACSLPSHFPIFLPSTFPLFVGEQVPTVSSFSSPPKETPFLLPPCTPPPCVRLRSLGALDFFFPPLWFFSFRMALPLFCGMPLYWSSVSFKECRRIRVPPSTYFFPSRRSFFFFHFDDLSSPALVMTCDSLLFFSCFSLFHIAILWVLFLFFHEAFSFPESLSRVSLRSFS